MIKRKLALPPEFAYPIGDWSIRQPVLRRCRAEATA
jgi:hypothetical protein